MVRRGVPLAPRTTFAIGGKAEYLLSPRSAKEFAAAYAAAMRSGLAVHILGLGSNLLVADDGVPGVVITTRYVRHVALIDGSGRVRVGAGTPLPWLIRWATWRKLGGLEGLAGIPGSVGGAVVMNAGTAEMTIGEVVRGVWCVDARGHRYRRDGEDVRWDYRATDLKDPVVEVELALHRDDPRTILKRTAAALRRRQDAQPLDLPSAGCFFRNPPGDAAGRLLELAGMKGECSGGAEVSAKHANFIVNRGGARASDVIALGNTAKARVLAAFGVRLEEEVHLWPCDSLAARG